MYLYKFSSIEMNKLACLQANLIWFSSLANCNDPFEGAHVFLDIDNHEEATKEIKRAISFVLTVDLQVSSLDLEEKKRMELAEIMRRGSLSMSLHCNEKTPHLNNLMWSHYADGMKGYCLKFNKNSFINSIYKITSNDLVENLYCKLINYVDSTPKFSLLSSSDVKDAIFSKSDHWMYENEYRLTSSMIGAHSYDANSLEEIIIGYKMPLEQQIMVARIVKSCNPNASLKEAVLSKDSYEIEIADFIYEEKTQKLKELSLSRDKIIKESIGRLISNAMKNKFS